MAGRGGYVVPRERMPGVFDLRREVREGFPQAEIEEASLPDD